MLSGKKFLKRYAADGHGVRANAIDVQLDKVY